MKVIFLDRDGVVNKERGEYTWYKKDFVFNDGLFESLHKWKSLGYKFVIVTNQGGIAKGLYSVAEFRELSEWMLSEMTAQGINVLKTYFSPDHDDFTKSLSRKPNGILFERAIHQFEVDPKKSFMIGDSERDIIAAERFGIHGILIEPNSSLSKIENIIENGRG